MKTKDIKKLQEMYPKGMKCFVINFYSDNIPAIVEASIDTSFYNLKKEMYNVYIESNLNGEQFYNDFYINNDGSVDLEKSNYRMFYKSREDAQKDFINVLLEEIQNVDKKKNRLLKIAQENI